MLAGVRPIVVKSRGLPNDGGPGRGGGSRRGDDPGDDRVDDSGDDRGDGRGGASGSACEGDLGPKNGSVGGARSRSAARWRCGAGSSGQAQDGGLSPGSGRDGLGRARGSSLSADDGNAVRDIARSEFSSSGSRCGDGPRLPARRFISQRITVTATASPVAMAMVTNPPATHWVAPTASPERDDPAFCPCTRPATSAPTT